MTHRTRRGRFRMAALLALALVMALPATVLAHSELESASPADGDTVESTVTEVRATFTAPLAGDSSLTVRNAGGDIVAQAGIDPTNDQLIVIELDGLAPGAYEVRWVAVAEDGDIERGTYSFTVVAAPSPSPEPVEPSATPEPSASVTASPSPSTAPSATPDPSPDPSASSTDVLLPILAALVLVLGVGGYLLLRRRPSGR